MNFIRKRSFYENYIKRVLDIIYSLVALVLFSWLYLIIAILVKRNLGSPVLFKQPRPGIIDINSGEETIFMIYKFRTMNNECDEKGRLLPDEPRLEKFGRMLRATSLDELPQAINILKGDMSIIGPRPQLVRDIVFMSEEQRRRHLVKPGLSGLAQVNGRNAVSWEDKLNLDLEYIDSLCFKNDLLITLKTIKEVFIRPNIAEINGETDITLDYGDYLLEKGAVSKTEYDRLQQKALSIISKHYNEN